MKKIFLFAAAAMVSLSSCVQTEDVYTGGLNEIGFKSAAVRADGANVVSGTEFTGAMTVAGAWDQAKGVYKQYFAPTKFVKDGTNDEGKNVWSGEPARYWPFGGQMQFVAYYPNAFGTFTETIDETNGITGYVVTDIENEDAQQDVLYSDRVYCADVPSSTQALMFYHALSQIQVNFKTNNDDANVILKSVTLHDVKFDGTLNVNCINDKSVASWSATSEATDHVFDTIPSDLTTALNTSATSVLILPADAQTKMTIVYTHGEENKELTKVVDLNTNGAKWEMGKKYIYNFNINMNEIDFTVVVKDWVSVDSGDITI